MSKELEINKEEVDATTGREVDYEETAPISEEEYQQLKEAFAESEKYQTQITVTFNIPLTKQVEQDIDTDETGEIQDKILDAIVSNVGYILEDVIKVIEPRDFEASIVEVVKNGEVEDN